MIQTMTFEGLTMITALPRRPNGEAVYLQPRQSGPYKSSFEGRAQGSEEGQRSVWPEAPETPEDREKRQIVRLIEHARSDLVKRVSISDNFKEL